MDHYTVSISILRFQNRVSLRCGWRNVQFVTKMDFSATSNPNDRHDVSISQEQMHDVDKNNGLKLIVPFVVDLKKKAREGDSMGATSILIKLEQLHEKDPSFPLDNKIYTYVLQALANSNQGEKSALETENILRRMHQLFSSGQNKRVQPDAYAYEAVLSAWAKSRTGVNGAKRAEAILNHMLKLEKARNLPFRLRINHFNLVIKAWSICRGGAEAAIQCEAILRRLEGMENNEIKVWPTLETFNEVISAWSHAGTRDAPKRAEQILDYIDSWNGKAPVNRRIQPTVDTYNMIIASYVKSKDRNAARNAEALLYRMVNLNAPDEGKKGEGVEKAFGMVISCWSKNPDPRSAERAEQLLRVLEKNHEKGISLAKPNVIILSQVIDAWSKSRQPDAAQRAKAILDQYMASADPASRPNTISFNSMLNALANSQHSEAANDAERILAKMNELKGTPGWDVEPNSRSIVSYMTCLAKRSKENFAYAQKVENLIDTMLEEVNAGNQGMMPDSFAFTTAVNAWVWSKSEFAADGVIRVIDRMESLYIQGKISARPHAICYSTAVRFFIELEDLQKADDIIARMEASFLKGMREAAPDRLTYAALLNAYAQHGNSHERAMELFRRQQYQAAAGNVAAKPHNFCYNMVMASLAKSKDANVRSRALHLLDEMRKLSLEDDVLKPDAISFSTAINVLAKSPEKNSAARAIMLLTEMEARYKAGDNNVKPNLFSFNSVLNALSKARTIAAARKAEELLTKMTELADVDPKFSDVRPDLLSYTSVIAAWAGVKGYGTAQRAEAILREMIQMDTDALYPDVVTYNKVILSWVRNGNPKKAYELLLEMENSDKVDPDSFSYKTVLLGWAQYPGGVTKAESILTFLENEFNNGNTNLKPDTLCYKAVMAAWADTTDAKEKVEEIVKKLKAFESSNFVVNTSL
jgi:pentatricopeptide repeat protein